MANFAVVAPLNIVEQLDRLGTLGPTHLLLAHDVVDIDNRERYYMLFHPDGRAATNKKPLTEDNQGKAREVFIIMDNSVIELGTAVDPLILQEACETVHASCVVLPDVLEDSLRTRASCLEALESWSKYKMPPYMMVPQGKTLNEFVTCAQSFARHSSIKYWGVPRNLVKLHGSRRDAIIQLYALSPKRPIHMMGFSDNLNDDIQCARMPGVMSIDSAVPLRLKTFITLNSGILSTTHEPRGNWWKTAKFNPAITKNLSYIRKLVRGP